MTEHTPEDPTVLKMGSMSGITVEDVAASVLLKAINKGKKQTRLLTACVAVLTVLTLAIGGVAIREQVLADTIQHGAIITCQQANAARAANVATWKFFIGILINGDTKPADLQKAHQVIAFIEQQNQQRDCHALYGAQAASK